MCLKQIFRAKREGDLHGNNHTANQYRYTGMSDRDSIGACSFGKQMISF